MGERKYLSISEVAKTLGISRIAVYKKVKKGEIKAIRIGRQFAILNKDIITPKKRKLKYDEKARIQKAVDKTIKEYGETLRLLGRGDDEKNQNP